MSNDTAAEVAEAQKLEDLTGMGIPQDEIVDTEQSETESESKEEKPKAKAEEAKAKGKTDEDEEEVDDEDEEEATTSSQKRPAKSERPLKAAFKQIGELREEFRSSLSEIKQLLSKTPNSEAKKEAKEAVDEIAEFASRYEDTNPEGLKELLSVFEKQVMANLEKSGKLSKDLPEDIKEKLKLLDTIQAEKKAKEETLQFESEWNKLLPEIRREYPNASESLIAEAKQKMDEIAHTKEFHKYDLDYVLFKNKPVFNTLLKLAKSKSFETSSKQINKEENDEEDIDLDPENMTPEKMKAYNKKTYGV